jgi:hypothetical protein
VIGLPEVTWGNKNKNEEAKVPLVNDNKFSRQVPFQIL